MDNIRKAVYAGSFYSASKSELSKSIQTFLLESKPKKFKKKLCALIVPHAGHIYSGSVAAFGFNLIKETKPKKIILIGPSHHDYLNGAFSFAGEWESPLCRTKITQAQLPIVANDKEHCLEVQLPFLQTVLKKFEFTPIIYGDIPAEELADIINSESNTDSVLIASSDLSHYLSYVLAKKVDKETIDAILRLNLKEFEGVGDACGKTIIAALIILAKKNNWEPILIDYKNSGDTAGDKKGVVGYAAIAFFCNEKIGE